MEFSTVRALVGWAFQMSEAVPVKVQKFAEQTPGALSDLTPVEKKNMAVDILAKVGRLPAVEQAALAAIFTADVRAINAAAKALPHTWPTGLRRELARAWASECGLDRSQQDIGETYRLSQRTVSDRWRDAQVIMDRHFFTALAVMEVQVMDLVKSVSRRNAYRERLSA